MESEVQADTPEQEWNHPHSAVVTSDVKPIVGCENNEQLHQSSAKSELEDSEKTSIYNAGEDLPNNHGRKPQQRAESPSFCSKLWTCCVANCRIECNPRTCCIGPRTCCYECCRDYCKCGECNERKCESCFFWSGLACIKCCTCGCV